MREASPSDENDAKGTSLGPLASDPSLIWRGDPTLGKPQLPADVVVHAIAKGDCGMCLGGRDLLEGPRIEILRIDALDAGWRAVGQTFRAATRCETCGVTYSTLHKLIPIECAEYKCPKCDRDESLDYRVERLELVDGRYVFTASVECKKCNHRSFLRRVVDQLNRITKVKIAADGVEFERSKT